MILSLLLAVPVLLGAPAGPEVRTRPAAAPDALEPASEAAARKLLLDLGKRLAEVELVRSGYTQKRTTELLDVPVVSSGVLYLRRTPGCVLFHSQKPRESWIRSDATSHQTYDPKRKRAQRLVFENNAAAKAILSGFFGDFAGLDDVFRIAEWRVSDAERVIRLIPRQAELELHLRDLRLAFDPKAAALRSVGYTSARGDTIRIEFAAVELEPKLEDAAALFDSRLPKGVKVDERRIGGRR